MIKNFHNNLIRKCRDKSAFTLTELLTAILIMTLVMGIVAAGIPVVFQTYKDITDASNAQLTLSTAVTNLRDELGDACNVSVDANGTAIEYTSGATGYETKISLVDGNIAISDYAGTDFEYTHRLVSSKASSGDFVVTYDTVEKNGSVICFNDFKVLNGNEALAELEKLELGTAD